MRRTREDSRKKKYRHMYSVAGKCCNFSYFVDKTQSTQNKWHVNFFFLSVCVKPANSSHAGARVHV